MLIANLITIIRLILIIPLAIILYNNGIQNLFPAFIFIFIILTDFLDDYLKDYENDIDYDEFWQSINE